MINSIAALIAALTYAFFKFKEESQKRKVHSIVHLQSKTEEAETMDFALTLFEDESAEAKAKRISEVFETCEARRKFNNDRLQQLFQEQQEKIRALKKEA